MRNGCTQQVSWCSTFYVVLKISSFFVTKGEGRLGTNESAFNNVLATRSWAHLKQLMAEYQAMTGHSLEDAVAREFSLNAEKGLLGIRKLCSNIQNCKVNSAICLPVQCAHNRPAYFAKRLNKAISGLGTKDNTLIRIIVSRSDIDLGSIKLEYLKMYGHSLQTDVAVRLFFSNSSPRFDNHFSLTGRRFRRL